jgi:hypothetical protein
MKKLLVYLLFFFWWFLFPPTIFGACSPPNDYSSCPQLNPDLNINNRGYALIDGQLQYIPFQHPIDPNAPQLSTLFPGNPSPAITALYQVNDWNWSTNSPDGPIPRPPDLPSQYDWATLVGFLASPGQAVLVPASGYTIGEGNQAIVLYASPNSITIHYGLVDSVASGYTIHLQNIRVDPQLLSLYNQLNQEGREALPALAAGEKIGEAVGNSVLVSIRDSGAFMDPRWLYDWFQKLDPAVAKNLVLKWMRLIASQKYGECQADQPFLGGPITKGDSFEVKITSCFGSVDNPSEKIQALLKTINLDFPNNQKIATHLHQETLKKLTPPSYTPRVRKKSALGKVAYEVCEQGTTNWFNVEKEVEFKTPEWMNEMADTGEELAKMLLPPGSSSFSFNNTSLASSNSQEKVLGETNNLLAQKHSYSMNISPQVTPLGGNNYSVCWSFQPKAEGCGLYDVSGNLSVNVDGKNIYGSFWGPVRAVSGPYLCSYAPFPGPISLSASPGSTISVCVNVTGVNHNCGEDPRPFLSGCASCKIGPHGEVQGCGAAPLPTPTPRMCESYSSKGENLIPEIVCVAGNCVLKDKVSNPANSLFNSLIQAGLSITQALQEVLSQFSFPLCSTKTYIVTPILQTPYTFEADNSLRTATFSIFKVPSNDTKRAFEFKHAVQNSTQGSEASPLTSYPSEVEIFGQAGVKNSYDWVQKALLPPQIYSPSTSPLPSSQLTSIPFRDSSVIISVLNKEKVVEQVLKSWPNSKIKNQWDFVYQQAVSHGWNPAFVIALWIEESGASGVDAYDLGCLDAPANNLSAQLNCLFSRPYANSSFEEFMCQYSEGKPAPCQFTLNPNFPGNLEYWYRLLTGSS